MRLDKYQEMYEYFTGKASEINRQLALAGIAIIWIFKTTQEEHFTIPQALLYPLICIIISLGLDFMQYIYQGTVWAIFYGYHRRIRKKNDNEKVKHFPQLNIASWIMFGLKIIFLIIAYIQIGDYIIDILTTY